MRFTLPWPPSVNHYWRTPNRGPLAGRTLVSAEGRAYRTNAVIALLEQSVPRANLCGRVSVSIEAHPPDLRRRDLDNLLKPVLDALTAAQVLEDDRFVDDLRIRRGPVVPGGLLRLEVGPVS